MSDNPSATFFFKDWRDDLNLRRCTFEQHGLWMFMLCFAHNPDPDFGYVIMPNGGRDLPAIAAAIAELRGCHASAIMVPLQELHKRHVFSLDDRGFVYCRRMVRNHKVSKLKSEAGIKGAAARWGNDLKAKRKRRSHRQNDGKSHDTRHSTSHNKTNGTGMAENASPYSTPLTPIKGNPLTPFNAQSLSTPNPNPEPTENARTLPPAPSPKPHEAPRADAERFANEMGVTLTGDQSRMHWPDTIARAVEVEGLDFERHVLPAAREARAKGKLHLAYALAIARSYRAEGRSGPVMPAVNGQHGPVQPAGVKLPEDGDDGWRLRLRLCVEQATEQGRTQREVWPLTWGPFPFQDSGDIEPTTLVPMPILQGIIDDQKRREAKRTSS